MLQRLLPTVVDNRFDGHPAAVWLFVPLALMKLALGFAHMLRADGGAQSVSHMPLDLYPEGAAQNIVGLMARMGLEQGLLGLVFVLVLLRYRALIPLMYGLMVLHYVGAKVVGAMKPLALAAPSGASNMHLVTAVLAVFGFVLALAPRGERADGRAD
jgi:hypothetical protein